MHSKWYLGLEAQRHVKRNAKTKSMVCSTRRSTSEGGIVAFAHVRGFGAGVLWFRQNANTTNPNMVSCVLSKQNHKQTKQTSLLLLLLVLLVLLWLLLLLLLLLSSLLHGWWVFFGCCGCLLVCLLSHIKTMVFSTRRSTSERCIVPFAHGLFVWLWMDWLIAWLID